MRQAATPGTRRPVVLGKIQPVALGKVRPVALGKAQPAVVPGTQHQPGDLPTQQRPVALETQRLVAPGTHYHRHRRSEVHPTERSNTQAPRASGTGGPNRRQRDCSDGARRG
ncbi:hypothetical protein FRC12_011649 [Ceratobasidium sp. 428]|nr:hypothetical protein FRC12_011649 [Ceratobasidium sp. 428]